MMGTSKGWDHFEATALSLSYRNDINDIYSNSWGYIDFYQSLVAYMHKRVKKALRDSAERVRKSFSYILVLQHSKCVILYPYHGVCFF